MSPMNKPRLGRVVHQQARVQLYASEVAVTSCDGVRNPANGHCYVLLKPDTWTGSEKQAIALGGHLATINDAAEDLFVFNAFTDGGHTNRSLWIGLTDQLKEGVFQWVSGEAVTYTDFTPGQPNNNGGIENFVHMWAPDFPGSGAQAGEWNDFVDATVVDGISQLFGVAELNR